MYVFFTSVYSSEITDRLFKEPITVKIIYSLRAQMFDGFFQQDFKSAISFGLRYTHVLLQKFKIHHSTRIKS